MCVTCGCGQGGKARIEGEHEHILEDGTRIVHNHDDAHHGDHVHDHVHADRAHEHEHVHKHADEGHLHTHTHASAHEHRHGHVPMRRDASADLVHLETALLEKNDRIAERNRGWLAGRDVLALNLMASPGAGKTTLLVRTLADIGDEMPMAVIEGDQETSHDADRIRATGARAVQVNTGAGCHLEADMLDRALHALAPLPGSVLFIENVGNLVCPSLFDLGERARVVMLSVTEGDDKPLKYPHMFRSADLVLLTKMDLLPHVAFDPARAEANARAVKAGIPCLRVSATSGEGLDAWYGWLRAIRSGFVAGAAS
jgi:hydrogenase nickel incorporation protein HypB